MQLKFHQDKARVKGSFGGNRSGKTEEKAEYVLTKCLNKPKQRWWAVAETFPDSVNIQQLKVWNLVPKNRIKYGDYNEITGFPNRKLLFDNGSMIIFKSYDQGAKSFASDSLDGIWFDEEPPIEIVKESRMRLIDRDGELIFSMTAVNGITEFVSEIFEDADIIESEYAPLVDEVLPRVAEKNGVKFYFLWNTENPHIDQRRLLQDAKLMSRDEIKCRFYGIPLNLVGRILPQFNKQIHVMRLDDMPVDHISGELRHYKITMILDPHDHKPWAMKWVALHKTGTAYCVDEWPNRDFKDFSEHKTYSEYGAIIREKEENLKDIFGTTITKRIIDPNFGNKTMQLAERQGGQSKTTPKAELKKLGFRFNDGIDSIEAGHMKLREVLHYEKKGEELIKRPLYYYLENCINSIKCASKYSYKDLYTAGGEEKKQPGPSESYKDYVDLDRYYWMSNPKYLVSNTQTTEADKVY